MRQLYLRVDSHGLVRKIMLDMASVVSHKQIRLPKYRLEEGLYLPYYPDPKNKSVIEKLFLTKDKIVKEDADFYYFDFKFKADQVQGAAG